MHSPDGHSQYNVTIYQKSLTISAKAVKTEVGRCDARQPMCSGMNECVTHHTSVPRKEPWLKQELGDRFRLGLPATLPNIEEPAGDSSWTMTTTNGMTYLVETPRAIATNWNSAGGTDTWHSLQHGGCQEKDPQMNAVTSNAFVDYVTERKPTGFDARLSVECDVEMTSHAAATYAADAAYGHVTTYPSPPMNHCPSYAGFSASDAGWMQHHGNENWSYDDSYSFYQENTAYPPHCTHSPVTASVYSQPMTWSAEDDMDAGLAILAKMAGDERRCNNYC